MSGTKLWNVVISTVLLVVAIAASVTMLVNGAPEWPLAITVVALAAYMVIFFARQLTTEQQGPDLPGGPAGGTLFPDGPF